MGCYQKNDSQLVATEGTCTLAWVGWAWFGTVDLALSLCGRWHSRKVQSIACQPKHPKALCMQIFRSFRIVSYFSFKRSDPLTPVQYTVCGTIRELQLALYIYLLYLLIPCYSTDGAKRPLDPSATWVTYEAPPNTKPKGTKLYSRITSYNNQSQVQCARRTKGKNAEPRREFAFGSSLAMFSAARTSPLLVLTMASPRLMEEAMATTSCGRRSVGVATWRCMRSLQKHVPPNKRFSVYGI